MRVTLARRGVKEHQGPWRLLSFSQSLRRSRQMLHSEGFQSERYYRRAHIFYTWTLDLLCRTLRKARRSQSHKLTKALSKPFIPWPAPILFPRRIKQVSKAIGAYLEKASRPVDQSNLQIASASLCRRSGPSSLEIFSGAELQIESISFDDIGDDRRASYMTRVSSGYI